MTDVTHLQRLLNDRLETKGHPPLDDLVPAMRNDGISWRKIAAEITSITGEPCSANNLCNWYLPTAKVAS